MIKLRKPHITERGWEPYATPRAELDNLERCSTIENTNAVFSKFGNIDDKYIFHECITHILAAVHGLDLMV
jgi:hypothetical protein